MSAAFNCVRWTDEFLTKGLVSFPIYTYKHIRMWDTDIYICLYLFIRCILCVLHAICRYFPTIIHETLITNWLVP